MKKELAIAQISLLHTCFREVITLEMLQSPITSKAMSIFTFN